MPLMPPKEKNLVHGSWEGPEQGSCTQPLFSQLELVVMLLHGSPFPDTAIIKVDLLFDRYDNGGIGIIGLVQFEGTASMQRSTYT